MRVATVDGLVTLYYDGSKELFNRDLELEWIRACQRTVRRDNDIESLNLSLECKEYIRQRLSWQQIIVVDGVTEIPAKTFKGCKNIKRVIFADTVTRIGMVAFSNCKSLQHVRWPLNLENIGERAFSNCNLSSVFIPPRCQNIGDYACSLNDNLEILNVPQNTALGLLEITGSTKLAKLYMKQNVPGWWLTNINFGNHFDLHRICSSFEPTLEMILDTMKERGGPKTFKVENNIGITPSRYLKENPYAHVKEKEVIEKYILQMIGEL
ncbi:hypothetical protein CTEN210_00292 [Chaetoceros tenuissimus]|uniref:Leucine-rich repeat domain-containing protein n=1 Tax=Chaetoceros tenuissimus TaxID=426638 RepID=A0AAD3GZ08_9STRA|nr:hypothetical protein CTEN210_00292 [Chaetoceros tenuissimus]